jgi:serine/threonine-protein kinase
MSARAAALSELSTLWQARGIRPDALTLDSDGTLAAPSRTRFACGDTLLAARSESGELPLSNEALELFDVLGAGGMGVVWRARQASVQRDVAVKTVLAHRADARSSLIEEAWVGAALAHPNVIPVHTLASTAQGPAVVMKRVAGVSLQTILADPSAHERFRADRLEASLRVLVSVCRAIELAHRRGILHLDLKPDNVMVGEFGEVYVLDWGLAAALPHGPSWLARASAIDHVAGTPAYMAPELTTGDGSRIDERTDVYLLGGILHTVVTQEPLHTGESVLMVMLAAFLSEPKAYGPDVPAELVAILRRALHREPDQRFASARAFREALEGFLRHRSTDRLVRAAHDDARELGALLETGANDAEVEPRFSALALALEQARRGFPDHPELEALRESLLALRARHAIVRERPEAALAFLAEMRSPPASLREQAHATARRVRAREAHVLRLEAMSRELDLTLGSALRRRAFAILGALWLLLSLVLGALTRSGLYPIGYRELLVEGALLALVLAPWAYLQRDRFFANTANRRLYGGLIFTALAVELHWTACLVLGVPPLVAVAITPLYYTFAFATLAIALDRRLFYGAGALGGAAVAAALWPALAFEIAGVGGGLAVALILVAWRERPAREA